MTEAPSGVTKIIVVAEHEVYDLLRDCGALWDVQHPVASVSQMWDELSGGRLDSLSAALVFSDSTYAAEGELEQAIASMAPHAVTFVIDWKGDAANLLQRVAASAAAQGAAPTGVHVLNPHNKAEFLEGVRAAMAHRMEFPAAWSVATDGPIVTQPASAPVWQHAEHAEQPTEPAPAAPAVAAPVAPVAPVAPPAAAPVAAPAPAYTPPPVAPAPATPAYTAPVTSHGQDDPLNRPPMPGQVTFAVTSSKGGSGKSTTAMMLAAQISHSSRLAYEQGKAPKPLKVVLVDMDTRDGQVASLIGKYLPTALTIRVSPTWDEQTILDNLVHDPKLGIDALLAPVRPRTADDVGPDFYRHVIRSLQRTHDVVIMDTSVNYLDPLISTVCLPEATAILFVTTLATTSVQGMARALREITESTENGGMGIKRNKIGIVVNQAVTEVGMERDQVLQAALKVPIVGAIPLATKDVLTATNFNRMHHLLSHPLLGPAYFRLASMCLPNTPLVSVVDANGNPAETSNGMVATAAPANVPVANGHVPVPAGVAAPAGVSEADKKRGLFRRG